MLHSRSKYAFDGINSRPVTPGVAGSNPVRSAIFIYINQRFTISTPKWGSQWFLVPLDYIASIFLLSGLLISGSLPCDGQLSPAGGANFKGFQSDLIF